MRGYAARGSEPNMRRAAALVVPTVEHHLELAHQMKKALGG